MKDLQVTAKAGKDKDSKSAILTIKAPENLAEATEMYGEEAVLTNAMSNFTVTVQGRVRAAIKAGKSPKEIQAALGDAKMGVSLPRASADPTARIKSDWDRSRPVEFRLSKIS